jgi:acyl dehydratase
VATITEEAIEQLRLKIGEPRLTREEPTLEEASKDAIRHWARAIGDRDPRWTEEGYARLTPAGGIIAPPSMIYGFSLQAIGDRSGLPGVHSFFGGAEHEWVLPIRRNDRIDVAVKLVDVAIRHGEFAGRSVKQTSEVLFTNQNGELVAKTMPWGIRTERGTGSPGAKHEALHPAHYTPDEIERIVGLYAEEPSKIRGAEPRYWDDVTVGDSIGELIRGPWTATNSVCFMRVYGGQFLKTHSYWYDYLAKHPKAGRPNHQGIPEGPSRGHWDNEYARSVGVPAAYDYGPERIAWLCTLATYWAGDHGTLRKLKVTLRRFNLQGDLTTLAGRVIEKFEVDDRSVVRCAVSATDQRGVMTTAGEAEIDLPRRTSTSTSGQPIDGKKRR